MSILKSKQLSGSLDVTASYATTASFALNGGGASVSYITASGPFSLTGIEVADYSNDVAVTFVNNTLKFVFGTPLVPSAPTLGFNSTFVFDRFNRVLDTYDLSGSFVVNGYTLVSASLYTGSVLIDKTGTGTTLRARLTTSGSQTYRLEVTASSPLDGTLNRQSVTLLGPVAKVPPTAPTISATSNVQLGTNLNLIEQGATGTISFTSAYGNSNGYTQVSLVNSTTSPITVPSGNAGITITATATYTSPGTDNVPTVTPSIQSVPTVYTKIRSVRYGASIATSFTQAQLEDLSLWDTTLGGTIGIISKGTQDPDLYTFTAVTNENYIYIVTDSSYPLTGIINTGNNANDLTSGFTKSIVGLYAVYRSNGISKTSIIYRLET
jgi:hypothetical protein